MDDKWSFLLDEFRRLGGISDNILLKNGKNGRGIFSLDPNQKSKIFTPSKLLIKKQDIHLQGEKLRVINEYEYDPRIIVFFNFYQDNFSYNALTQETIEVFEKGLSEFNLNLKKLIKKNFLIDLEQRHKGSWDEIIKKQFLNTRVVNFKNDDFIAPIWELVNHKVKSLPFIIDPQGISTPNYFPTNCEIRHSYNYASPIQRFLLHGFFSKETIVFSVPFETNIKNTKIKFCCKGNALKNDSIKIQNFKDRLIINGLPIADSNNPTLPIHYFEEICKRTNDININLSKEILFKIKELNIQIRRDILNESNLINSDISNLFSKVINYEMNLIQNDN